MATMDRQHTRRDLRLVPRRERFVPPADPDDDCPDDDPDFDDAA